MKQKHIYLTGKFVEYAGVTDRLNKATHDRPNGPLKRGHFRASDSVNF